MVSSLVANARSNDRLDEELRFVLLLCGDCHRLYDRRGDYCDDTCRCKDPTATVAAEPDEDEQIACCNKMEAQLNH
jgi:hypothetical protein